MPRRSLSATACAILCALAALSITAPARATTIASYTTDNGGAGGGVVIGQSFTTAAGGPWNDLVFSFLNGSTPVAPDTAFLFSQQYTGTVASLSSSSTGFIAEATGSGGAYTFNPSTALAGGTQYWIYLNGDLGVPGVSTGSAPYSGGTAYDAFAPTLGFSSTSGTYDFTLTSGPASSPTSSVPEISAAGAPSLIVLVLGSIVLVGNRRGRATSK